MSDSTHDSEPELLAIEMESLPPPLPPPKGKMRLGDMLINKGFISQEQLGEALKFQRAHGGRIGAVLLHLGFIDDSVLSTTLGRQLGLEVAAVESINPAKRVIDLVPESVIRKYEVVPLAAENGKLTIGMTDPRNLPAIDEVSFITGFPRLEVRLITEATFERFLNTRFASEMLLAEIAGNATLDFAFEMADDGWDFDPEEVDESAAGEPPVVRLANYLFEQAIHKRASDIHIEPYETFFRIRFRIDGRLYTVMTPPNRIHPPLISRIKILSEMDIAERRKPQDGHMMLKMGDEGVHFRVSTLPTVYGEKCVIRLLKKEAHLADIERLGFSKEQLEAVKRCARLPQGLILVTGPTGSGKTTTLHAVINYINEPETNIVTVEDPVESTIPGINHVQVQEKGGTTFASALRAILRQDPDIVLIGEMRDPEVSQIALRAALTGHLVLSTLHTNGVIETFARLIDMKLETYLLANSVNLVLAQRLLRRVCSHCAVQMEVPQDLIDEFKITPAQLETALVRRPVGCPACLNTGYKGRVAVYESLVPSPEIREVLRAGGDEQSLLAVAANMNVVWMHEAAVGRALVGETTFEEVRRVLGEL